MEKTISCQKTYRKNIKDKILIKEERKKGCEEWKMCQNKNLLRNINSAHEKTLKEEYEIIKNWRLFQNLLGTNDP